MWQFNSNVEKMWIMMIEEEDNQVRGEDDRKMRVIPLFIVNKG